MRARWWHCLGLVPALGTAALAAAGPTERFIFPISSQLMVPPTSSPAAGSADLLLDVDTASLHGFITFGSLRGTLTSVQIHGPASRTATGPLLFDLGPTRHVLLSELTHPQLQELRQELWYLEVRTTVYPNGEERGQIVHAVTRVDAGTWGGVKALFRSSRRP